MIKLGGVIDAAGSLGLAEGDNVITVEVTAEDGATTQTYTVTVTRQAPATDATLSALSLSGITLTPTFAAAATTYAAAVDYAVEETDVTPTTNHAGAGYVIKLGGVIDAAGSLGDNVITGRATTQTYTVTVTRQARCHLKRALP